MTSLDDELVPEVVDIIAEVGVTATFTTYPSKSTNKATSVVTLGAPVDINALVTPPSDDMIMLSDGDGLAEQVEARKILLATGAGTSVAITFTPERGQPVTVASEESRIIELKRINSGAQIAAWKIWLEK